MDKWKVPDLKLWEWELAWDLEPDVVLMINLRHDQLSPWVMQFVNFPHPSSGGSKHVLVSKSEWLVEVIHHPTRQILHRSLFIPVPVCLYYFIPTWQQGGEPNISCDRPKHAQLLWRWLLLRPGTSGNTLWRRGEKILSWRHVTPIKESKNIGIMRIWYQTAGKHIHDMQPSRPSLCMLSA